MLTRVASAFTAQTIPHVPLLTRSAPTLPCSCRAPQAAFANPHITYTQPGQRGSGASTNCAYWLHLRSQVRQARVRRLCVV